MSATPKSSLNRYGGIFLIGVGSIGIVVAIVDKTSGWHGLWQWITGIAYLLIGVDMFRRQRQNQEPTTRPNP